MDGGNIIPLSTEKKTVVITGCTRGLGRAMAEGFVDRGDIVAGCGRSEAALQELREDFGDEHHMSSTDVADDEEVARFCEQVIESVGVPNLIVNNAGIINQNAPLWEISAEEFMELLEVNVLGTANIIRHFVPHLAEEGRSSVIVNFSSGWGRSASADVAPYCATKWAVEGMTEALAQELPPFIGAVALNPGIIHTEMLESCFGPGASSYPTAKNWARSAVPFLANLTPADSGKSLTAPS
ncbi:MAG: SDR family NAD(P)-dependent oxidoreductase [Verrucomicrobiota bacterium]